MSSKTTMERDYERAPEIAELGLEERPDGPGAAAMLAAAIGVFALDLLTVLAEASVGLHDWLESSRSGGRPPRRQDDRRGRRLGRELDRPRAPLAGQGRRSEEVDLGLGHPRDPRRARNAPADLHSVRRRMSEDRAEIVAAWATGIGIGLLVLMVVWLIGNRVAGLFWGPPVGPTVAFLVSIAVGVATAIVAGARLARRVRSDG